MIRRTRFGRDSRGLSTPVTHTLSIAITALLIIGLIAGVTGELDQRSESAATEELGAIGHKVASQFQSLDSSAATGGSLSVSLDLPADVVGRSYDIRLVPPGDCSLPGYGGTPSVCLRLSVPEMDLTEAIPIENTTRLGIESVGGGTYRLSAAGTGAATVNPAPVSIDQRVRVGISNIRRRAGGGLLNFSNQPPLPALSISPQLPRVGQSVVFDATGSTDDGTIVNYTYVFADDATISGPTTVKKNAGPITTFTPGSMGGNGGFYAVQLYVTDDDGVTQQSGVQTYKVSGLQYNNDYQKKNLDPGNPKGFGFSMTNRESKPINITHIYFDPVGVGSVNLKNPTNKDPEIQVDATYDGFVNYAKSNSNPNAGQKKVPKYGLLVDMDHTKSDLDDEGKSIHSTGPEPRLDPGDTAEFKIGRLPGPLLNDFDRIDWNVSVRYVVDDNPTTDGAVENPVPRTSQIYIDNGGAEIRDYRLEKDGQDVNLTFRSSKPLGSVTVDVGSSSGFSKTLSLSDFSNTSLANGFRYEAQVSSGNPGTIWANLTQAKTPNPPGYKSKDVGPATNESVFVSYSGYTWTDVTGSDPGALVAYYPLDGTSGPVTDASANSYSGQAFVTARGVPGTVGQAFEFAGGTDRVRINNLASYLEGKSEVTVTAWIEADSALANDRGIFTTDSGDGNDDDLELRYDSTGWTSGISDGLKGAVRTGSGGSNERIQVEVGPGAQTTNWQHVALTWTAGDDPSVYADGTLLSTAASDGSLDSSDTLSDLGQFRIGGKTLAAAWDGKIDEVRVYDEALSAGAIRRARDYTPSNTTWHNTSWDSAAAIQPSKLAVEYAAAIEYGSVDIRVQSDTDGDGYAEENSTWKTVTTGGSGTLTWSSGTSISSTGTRLRVQLRIDHGKSAIGPAVDFLRITEVP